MSVSAILGKKLGMTQVFDKTGKAVPVTVVQAGPCAVLQVMNVQRDGYNGVQLGFGDAKTVGVEKRSVKLADGGTRSELHRMTIRKRGASLAAVGHAAKAGVGPKRFIREVRQADAVDLEVGAKVDVSAFEGISHVDVIGTTKGKGYAGVMKRHNFRGLGASHGVERKHRSPGSISSHGTDLGHGGNIKKGKRMAGRMGGGNCTRLNLELISVDLENNLMVIKGNVPGANGGYVIIRGAKGLDGGKLAAKITAQELARAEAAKSKGKKKR